MQQLIVKSLTGQHYTAQAIIDRNRRVNGERDITLSFSFNEINSEFIKDIETGWKLNFQGDWYHLFNEKTDVNGNKSFSGVLDFYHYMNGFWHMDEVENKSMTVQDAMIPLFKDKDYVLQIIDNFTASTMSYSKQQNSTERFSYFVDRFNAEYNIPIGTKTVQLRNKIGVTRNDVIIHEDDNLEDLSIDIDSSSFCTAIKGYYDFQKPKNTKDGEELVPTKEYDYISPMADKYGVIWGEPIHDERFSKLDSIKAACKEKQENSYKISYTIKKSLLGNALNEGDYVRFIAPSFNINTYVRVVEIKEQFDDELDLIDEEYTFGNENIATAFSKMQYEAIRDVSDIMRGKKAIPYSVLPKAVREATTVINAGSTTQFYYREDGIYGYNTSNPLGVTRYNANGIGFSQNGGQTFSNAMTYLGIVANAITTGTIDANNVRILGTSEDKYMLIDGDNLTSYGTYKRTWQGVTGLYETFTRIKSGIIRIRNEKLDRSLYYTDFGISTFVDGDGDEASSGTLAFFDNTYSTARGVTLQSNWGVVALKSALNRIILDAQATVNIESNTASIYLRPMKDNRNGKNEFRFWVKDNDSASDTDGVLSYGSITGGNTNYGSGIRFDKSLDGSTVYATNNNGDKGSGNFQAKDFIKTSTREIKKDILELSGGIDAIKSLTPVSYKYILDDSDDIGFIAEDSDCIAVADGKAISVQKVATWAVLATKEQQDIIEQHEEKIKQQEERINQQEESIKQQQETIDKLIERIEALENK